jgi:5'-3' exonuclease
MVLPSSSSNLLPIQLRKLVTNQKSAIKFLYPEEFEEDYINKKQYWMGIPKLPELNEGNIFKLKRYFAKYRDELTEIENSRNILIEPTIIN